MRYRFLPYIRAAMWNHRQQEISTSPPEHYDYHCFISYTTREEEVKKIKPFVDAYTGALRSQGVVFYDGWNLREAHYEDEELRRLLRDGIEQSAFSVCFLSPGYYESEWCKYEWYTTEEIHNERGLPAQKYSILPICWKEYFSRPSLLKTFGVGWQKQSEAAEIIADAWQRDPEHICGRHGISSRLAPLSRCVNRTFEYLHKWYPNQGWGKRRFYDSSIRPTWL
jgi:hypothetical protein